MERAVEVGAEIRRAFEAARTRIPSVGEVRGLGLMLGLDVLDPNTGLPASSQIMEILKAASRAGVVLTKCGEATLRIGPPLTITREQAASGVEMLLGVLQGAGAAARA